MRPLTALIVAATLIVCLAVGRWTLPRPGAWPLTPPAQRGARATAVHPVDAYARAVLAGRVPAGKYHRLACVRHLRDRAREGTPGFPYRFDAAKADRFFRFAAKLKHYKGEWAGTFIVLQPWQQFRLGSIFGWVHTATDLRRYRAAYNEIPRKNGKSLEAAIVAIYVTFYDGEPGAEGYCLATKRSQAMLVFRDAKKLVQSSGLKTRLRVMAKNIHDVQTASKLEALGMNPEDGLNPSLIIIDEFHKLKNRDLLDVMETATGARRQPLSFQITTAGDHPVSPCGDQHDYAVKILEQVVADETFFAFIAHADLEDDWTLDATARKANPNYGISIKPDDLAALVTKALSMPGAAAAYQQKRLNLWVNTDAPWLSLEGWRTGQSTWSLEELRGAPCFGAIDLSSKIDLSALALVFPPTATRATWRYVVRCFTPADTLLARARRDRAPYLQWAAMKIPGSEWAYLTTNPGNRIDQDVIRQAVKDARDRFGFDIKQIGFDPWNAATLEQELTEDGFEVVEIPQTLKHMSLPSKDFEADVLDSLADFGGDPQQLWMASNVVVYRDNLDNIKPIKKRSRGRIDGTVAAIMGRKLAALEGPPSDGPLVVAA
jgi:phage terminase large subunit-like protein